MSSDKLSQNQHDALETPEGAKVLVVSMNKEINVLKKTVVQTQNELEGWRSKYHDADKSNSVLGTKLEFFRGIEILKYFLSAIATSYGVNLLSSHNNQGWFWIIGAAIGYAIVATWQEKSA